MERRLIEFVRQHRCLYDRTDPSYKNIALRERLWLDFARNNNDCVISIKKRWKTLRDRYFRLQKQEESGHPPCKTYKYFNMLKFLDNCKNSRRKYYGNFDESVPSQESFKIEDVMLEDTNMEDDYLDENECTEYRSRSVPKEEADEVEEEVVNSFHEAENVQNFSPTTPTPFSLFMQSLAMQIAEAGLSTTAVLQLEMKILKIVTDAIIMKDCKSWK